MRRCRRQVLVDETNTRLADYTEKLAGYTKMLAVATIVLALTTGLLFLATQDISESNEILTNVTEEFYSYHPPDVSLISGFIDKLYVLKYNNSETYFTISGYYSTYNSALADDIALVQQADIGNPIIDDNIVFVVEGIVSPFPVTQGKFSGELPLLSTLNIKQQSIEKNASITINFSPIYVNVTHPLNKTRLANLTAIESTTIIYTMGEEKATVQMNGGHTHSIYVGYTEDVEMYNLWKKTMLLQYGHNFYMYRIP